MGHYRNCRLSPEVSLRSEHFGGLLYHRETGKLYMLGSPILVSLLSDLTAERPLDEVLGDMARKHGLSDAEIADIVTALDSLVEMGVLRVA